MTAPNLIITQKRCTCCKLEKPTTEFSKHKHTKDGLQAHCKTCRKAKCAEWYANNKAKQNDANNAWRAKNRDRFNAQTAERRARRTRAVPSWIDRKKVAALYQEAAARTAAGTPSNVDHIVPLQSPLVCGLHWEGNLQVIAGPENFSKGNRWWPDMP